MPDFRNSISDRDERVTASQLRAAENDAREATRGDVTFDELDRRYADPISRDELTALLPRQNGAALGARGLL